jgi:two-component system chemotaxis response regulator CheB
VIRLLVVDDSALVRRLLGEVFADEADVHLGFARDGMEALAVLAEFAPDVILLDIQMPQMDGLTCLDRIMVERPTPVVVFSSRAGQGAAETVEALALGAVGVIQKPAGALSLEIDAFAPRIREAVRAAAEARIRRTHRLAERVRRMAGETGRARPRRRAPPPAVAEPERERRPAAAKRAGRPDGVVLVGCSTGGPAALDALLAPLPADFPWPILVAQHMPQAFTGALARRLDGLCRIRVGEVVGPTPLEPGCAYIARGDADVLVAARPQGIVALAAPSSEAFRWHPSVDRMVDSAMAVLPAARLAGVLMTGMGDDGAAAMTRLRRAGGFTLAEAEETAVVWGMPGELVRAGGAGRVAPLDALAAELVRQVAR